MKVSPLKPATLFFLLFLSRAHKKLNGKKKAVEINTGSGDSKQKKKCLVEFALEKRFYVVLEDDPGLITVTISPNDLNCDVFIDS